MFGGARISLAGTVLLSMVAMGFPAAAFAQSAVVADHTCTNLADVPDYWVELAKARFRLSYGHTSHGSQIVSGMNVLRGEAGSLYYWDHDGTNGGLSLWDNTPSGDLGNPDRTTWATRTREMLDDPSCDRNVVMWSWCGQADTSEANIQTYLDLMDGLIADYPLVTFIFMTGHLNGSGEEGNLHARNNQIRDHVIATGGVLFDFADIESYDPDGEVYYLPLYADDGCNYVLDGQSHNWATEWCAANPGECSSCSCAHSQSLNCDMKGRAFWWLMVRLVARDAGDLNNDNVVDLADLQLLLSSYGDDAGGDLDHDGDTDLVDLQLLLANYGAGAS